MPDRPDQRELLYHVPHDGSTIGNVRLRSHPGWTKKRYLTARNALIDDGHLLRGRGRGGSVRRAVPVDEPRRIHERESDLYDPLRRTLKNEWSHDRWKESPTVVVTAHAGRADTGGRWTRPDITCVGIRRFRYVPGVHLDVLTFEVKLLTTLDVSAVYEALGHRRAATEVYVLVYAPFGWTEGRLGPVIDAADANGVGLILLEKTDDTETWEELLEAARTTPDPSALDQFIHVQLPDHREMIASAVHRVEATTIGN